METQYNSTCGELSGRIFVTTLRLFVVDSRRLGGHSPADPPSRLAD